MAYGEKKQLQLQKCDPADDSVNSFDPQDRGINSVDRSC